MAKSRARLSSKARQRAQRPISWLRCPCREIREPPRQTAPAVRQGKGSGTADAAAVTLEQFGPARQTAGAYQVKAYDSSVIRQPSCGQVDLSYFSDAALLGDSLTVGFSDYSINLGGALICGYTGVGPDAIVNRSAVKSSVRGSEVAMDVLTAAQPKSSISCWAPTR